MIKRRVSWILLWLLGPAMLTAAPQVDLGIDTLRRTGFAALQGQRVGLLTHPAGVDRHGTPTWEILHRAPQVNLVALYGPEHGVDGHAAANEYVAHDTHEPTGLPVYSLYGPHRKPTPEMLAGIDILVIDLQDLGVRSYTYVSAMKLAMEACFENDITVMVLDRPNPLGGLKADGPPLDADLTSYVGAFRVPYVHGLTIGELAVMAKKKPGVLDVLDDVRRRGKLLVSPMRGWRRDMLWPDTGLRWVPTSPAIPDLSAAMGYAMTGLGSQLGGFAHGYGTQYPFRLLTFPGRSPEAVRRALQAAHVEGLGYQLTAGRTPKGKSVPGVYLVVEDWNRLRPTEISFQMMRLACHWSPGGNPFADATPAQQRLFNIHVGSHAWWEEITTRGANARVERFVDAWARQAEAFHRASRPYWLYR